MAENTGNTNHVNNKPIICIDKDGNETTYESVNAAAKDIGLHPGQIARGYRENKPVKGFNFTYPNDTKTREVLESESRDSEFMKRAAESFDRPPFYMRGKMTEGKKVSDGQIANVDLDKLLKSISNTENN